MTVRPYDPQLLQYIDSLTRVRVAAGAIVLDERGGVLVAHTAYGNRIAELPGGALEPGESPQEGCIRELKEELGFAPPIGQLLCVDWVPPSPPWDGGLMFLFDGGVLTLSQIADIQLQSAEIERIEFVDPQRLESVLVPRLARRVLACLAVRGRSGVYLEDGISPASL